MIQLKPEKSNMQGKSHFVRVIQSQSFYNALRLMRSSLSSPPLFLGFKFVLFLKGGGFWSALQSIWRNWHCTNRSANGFYGTCFGISQLGSLDDLHHMSLHGSNNFVPYERERWWVMYLVCLVQIKAALSIIQLRNYSRFRSLLFAKCKITSGICFGVAIHPLIHHKSSTTQSGTLKI